MISIIKIAVTCLLLSFGSACSRCHDSEEAQVLDFHNRARAEVGTRPLKYDKNLQDKSYNWAYNLAMNNNCGLYHSETDIENLYASYGRGSSASLVDAAQAWYDEKEETRLGRDLNHYTAMIWKDATRVGCAKVTNPSQHCTVVACTYAPTANVRGQHPIY